MLRNTLATVLIVFGIGSLIFGIMSFILELSNSAFVFIVLSILLNSIAACVLMFMSKNPKKKKKKKASKRAHK